MLRLITGFIGQGDYYFPKPVTALD